MISSFANSIHVYKYLSTLLVLASFFIGLECDAKGKFKVDKHGKCDDPEFQEMVKERGYDVISFFDTVTVKPLRIYAFFLKEDKWGCIDIKGNERINPEYTNLMGMHSSYSRGLPIYHAYCIASKGDKYGVIDWEGEELLAFEHPQIDYKKYAFNAKEKCYYDSIYAVYSFDAYAETAYLDLNLDTITYQHAARHSGNWIPPRTLTDFKGSSLQENSGYRQAIYSIGHPLYKSGLYSANAKGMLIDFEYESLKPLRPSPHILAQKEKKRGVLDTLGQVLLPLEFSFIAAGRDVFYVYKDFPDDNGKSNFKMAIYNDSFQKMTEFKYSDVALDLADPNHILRLNGHHGVLNTEYKTIIPFEHEEILAISHADPKDNHYLLVNDGEFVIVNAKNERVTTSVYDNINPRRLDPRLLKGKPSIPKSDCPCRFHYVFQDGEVGILDSEFNEIVPTSYDLMVAVSSMSSTVHVRKNGLWGVINGLTGEILVPVSYKSQIQTSEKYMIEFNGDTRVIYSKDGEEILRFNFNHYTTITPIYLGLFQVHARDNNSLYYDGYENWVHF